MKKLKTILSIAASDPTGGAGIQADVKAAGATGVHCMTAVTAVTVQNSSGMKEIFCLPKGAIKAQVEAVLDDVKPDAVKVGMIGSPENGMELMECLELLGEETTVVVDPVLKASAGGLGTKQEELDPLVDFYRVLFKGYKVIPVPNFFEAKLILGESPDSIIDCASDLLERFCLESVIVTGGDFLSTTGTKPSYGEESLLDALAFKEDGEIRVTTCTSRYVETPNLHGTGCVFSSILASRLALGSPIDKAFSDAVQLTQGIIESSTGYNFGKSTYGPLNILGSNLCE